MILEKNCSSCGAANDPIVTNCAYCKTALPRLPIDTLPEEVLLKNSALWIGRLESLKDPAAYRAAMQFDRRQKISFGIGQFASITTKETFGLGDIVGCAEQYLSVLEARARNNPNLSPNIISLRERYKHAQEILNKEQSQKRSRRKLFKWGCLVIVLFILGGCGASIAITYISISKDLLSGKDHEDEAQRKDDKKKTHQEAVNERDRLNQISLQISEAISQKDFQRARLLLIDYRWNGRKPSGYKFEDGRYMDNADNEADAEIKSVEDRRKDFKNFLDTQHK